MFKKIDNVSNLRGGDKIILYGISDNAMSVSKKYFEVVNTPMYIGSSCYVCECYLIRKDGTRICRCVYYSKSIRLVWKINDPYLSGNYGNSLMHFYIDPKTPCELVIKNLQEEKRKINKKIMDCQHYMYQVNNE